MHWIYYSLFAIIPVVTAMIVFRVLAKKNSHLSHANFERIEEGMSYEQVVQLMQSHRGELISSSTIDNVTLTYYQWSGWVGYFKRRVFHIQFQNDRVVAKNKNGI